jgi:uridine kinase
VILGIAGGSCSGKSELAARVADRLGAQVLALDEYYRDLAELAPGLRGARNFDHPEALDWELLLDHLARLRQGEAVQVPRYDFARHLRCGSRALQSGGADLILEGILLLHREELRRALDLAVFLELSAEARLQRRVIRDTRERGRTAEQVREQHATTVEPMFRRYVGPTRSRADLLLDGSRPLAESSERVLAAVEAWKSGRAAP